MAKLNQATRLANSKANAAKAESIKAESPVRVNRALESAMESARNGIRPVFPDFSAATHDSYQKKIGAIRALIESADAADPESKEFTKAVSGLRNFKCTATADGTAHNKLYSTTPRAMARICDLMVAYYESIRKAAKAAAKAAKADPAPQDPAPQETADPAPQADPESSPQADS